MKQRPKAANILQQYQPDKGSGRAHYNIEQQLKLRQQVNRIRDPHSAMDGGSKERENLINQNGNGKKGDKKHMTQVIKKKTKEEATRNKSSHALRKVPSDVHKQPTKTIPYLQQQKSDPRIDKRKRKMERSNSVKNSEIMEQYQNQRLKFRNEADKKNK